MVGRKPGETTTVESVLPRNHPVAPLRGAPALVAVTIESVASIEPATVEQVVAEYGASNETRLRTQIRFALEQQRSQSVRSSLREQLSRALPSMFQIGVPECRVRLLTARAETEFRELARLRGWSDDQTRAGWIERRDDSRRECERIARERVILQSLPGDGDVEASEEVINARIADLAARRGVRPEEARSSLVKSGRYEEFINEVLGEALLDAMVRRATVRPVPEAEWQAAMEAGWG
jgi:trigger factor